MGIKFHFCLWLYWAISNTTVYLGKWTEWAVGPHGSSKSFVPSCIVYTFFNHPLDKYQQAPGWDVYWAVNTPFVFEDWINRGIMKPRLTVTFIQHILSEEFNALYKTQRFPCNSKYYRCHLLCGKPFGDAPNPRVTSRVRVWTGSSHLYISTRKQVTGRVELGGDREVSGTYYSTQEFLQLMTSTWRVAGGQSWPAQSSHPLVPGKPPLGFNLKHWSH